MWPLTQKHTLTASYNLQQKSNIICHEQGPEVTSGQKNRSISTQILWKDHWFLDWDSWILVSDSRFFTIQIKWVPLLTIIAIFDKISFQPAALDKLAHSMLHARHNYHRILLKYVSALRDIHTLKKVFV